MRRFAPVFLFLTLLAVAPACTTTTAEPGIAQGDVVLEEEIKRRIDEIPYMRGAELVMNLERLAHIGEPAVPRLRQAMTSTDDHMRSSALHVFGLMHDRRNIDIVHAGLADPSDVVRYEAAASLVELGDSRGFEPLVHGLGDEDLIVRYKCIEVLRGATQRDFGFEHDADIGTRRLAVRRWLDWLGDVQASGL